MKKTRISIIFLIMFAIMVMSSVAQAMSANVLYNETDLGSDVWQYDFTIENTSLTSDTHPYLWNLSLDFENSAYITILNKPENWSIGSYIGDLPDITDYVKMYSDAIDYDVFPGLYTRLSFTADYRLGQIDYEAIFSDHAIDFENYDTISGTASPVPIPAAVWLLGSGLIGLAGIKRKMSR